MSKKILRDSNPYDLKTHEEAPSNYISGEKLINYFNSHGIPFTVKDGENGILVEPENSEELSKAITKLLFDNELREKLGEAGYNFVHEECNCISMAKNSLRLYEQVVEDHDNK